MRVRSKDGNDRRFLWYPVMTPIDSDLFTKDRLLRL